MLSLFSELEASVNAFVAENDYNGALDEIRNFVVAVMNMQAAPGEVVGARKVDSLCELVGNSFFDRTFNREILKAAKPEKMRMIVLCTGLYKYGGTTLVIRDLINAHPEYDCTVIATDYLQDMTPEDLALSRIDGSGADVSICPQGDSVSKLGWLILKLIEAAPTRIFILNHHQDSVIISGASPFVTTADVVFYHHADYNMCLGVHLKGAIHVDPHNVGYHNCRTNEGLADNAYVPMTVDDRVSRRIASSFMPGGSLTTCSSGSYHKFRNFYLYPYNELIAERLMCRDGIHIHIGGISTPHLAEIRQTLIKRGLEPDRFVHVPWTASFWDSIVDRSVDLFIGSFPIGGARTTIEVMGAGIPIIMPDNYLSRFFSSRDIVYESCFIWKTPEEFSRTIRSIDLSSLKIHSEQSRAHFDLYYNGASIDLEETINSICRRDITPPPYDLYDYNPDKLDKFLHLKRIDELLAQHAADVALTGLSGKNVSAEPAPAHRYKSSLLNRAISYVRKKRLNTHDRGLSEIEQRLFKAISISTEGVGFDPAIYLERNPDVASAAVDPLEHFVKHGQYEGRGSSFFFSDEWHIEMNPGGGSSLAEVMTHISYTRSQKSRKKAAFFTFDRNSGGIPNFYVSEMIRSLAESGVNVDVYAGEHFATVDNAKGSQDQSYKSVIKEFIRSKSYDFALSLNNALVIPETVSSLNCTIVSILEDDIFSYVDRGHGIALSLPIHAAPVYSSFDEDAKSIFDIRADVSFLPFATTTKDRKSSSSTEQTEISWIAAMLGDHELDTFLFRVDQELPKGLELMAKCLADIQKTGQISMAPASQKAAKRLCEFADWGYSLLETRMQEIVTNRMRLQAVERLAPLGLKLYGNARWRSALMMSPAAVQSFRSDDDLRRHSDLCKVYDRSKISINIPQIHAGTGMQHRILDILASKSLLITQYVPNSDMELLFGADSPIVTFSDIDDLYEKCAYFLNNDTERLARVAACNALVAKGYSFQDRIIDYLKLSNPAQVNKIDTRKGAGSVSLIWPERIIDWASRRDRSIN
ncbi:glycosyltransferase family protein [Sphingomonas sp. PAMC 26621]|uniref:glycosyltransferase family protein n=1 Tax=Sphingomonas sp. PAMC 26621 TaxID=1112213 RepID=UPI0014784BD1|nr:glycosyltransferase [Sphingomonas sp. PAMC 26621]